MSDAPHAVASYLRTAAGQWTIAAAFLTMFVVLAWPQRVPSLTTANDDATYVLLSRSLRDGGYNSIHLVGAPVHTKYPPVFPALLAGVSVVAGESVDAFVAMNVVLSVIGLALLFSVARRRLPAAVALGGLALSASSPFLQGIAGTVMSEPAFLAFVALTIWLFAREPVTTGTIALACICATIAALTRTIGVTLVLAVIVLLLVERRWRAAALYAGILAAIAIALSLWLRARAMPHLAADYVVDALQTGSIAPSHPAAMVGRRIAVNAREYAESLIWLLSVPTVRGTVVDNVLWLVVVFAGLLAGLASFWRRWRIVGLFLVGYGALLLVWAWPVGRFLVPVLPLLALVFLGGLHVLVGQRTLRGASFVVLALTGVVTVTGVRHSASRIAARSRCDREQPMRSASCFNPDQLSLFAAARYVGAETPQSAIVMSSREATFYYLSERRLIPGTSITALPSADAAEFLRRQNVSYVVLNHVSLEDIPFAERLAAACSSLAPIQHFSPRTTVFRVLPAPGSDSRACEVLRAFTADAGSFRDQVF